MGQIFSQSTDRVLRVSAIAVAAGLIGTVGLLAYLGRPEITDAGYQPKQPVPFSHKLHAGNLGMDCRYCHSTVELGAHAAIPATETCMNCHKRVRAESPLLSAVRASAANDTPVPWVRVHKLPEYAYFNHQAHLSAGVSCVSCHGRVDQMAEVRQVAPLSMSWCLDCHRDPAANVRPAEFITKLDWQAPRDAAEIGREIIAAKGISPPEHCSGCHR